MFKVYPEAAWYEVSTSNTNINDCRELAKACDAILYGDKTEASGHISKFARLQNMQCWWKIVVATKEKLLLVVAMSVLMQILQNERCEEWRVIVIYCGGQYTHKLSSSVLLAHFGHEIQLTDPSLCSTFLTSRSICDDITAYCLHLWADVSRGESTGLAIAVSRNVVINRDEILN